MVIDQEKDKKYLLKILDDIKTPDIQQKVLALLLVEVKRFPDDYKTEKAEKYVREKMDNSYAELSVDYVLDIFNDKIRLDKYIIHIKRLISRIDKLHDEDVNNRKSNLNKFYGNK